MKVEQVAEIVNELTNEILGKKAIENNDLSKVVDIGKEIFDNTSVDHYVEKLIDHIGKVVFVNRPYSGRAPSVMMEGWEYGAVLEKIDADIPEADENKSWELKDGELYSQDIFKQPKNLTVKFYSDRVTFEVNLSFADMQVKSAFSNATQLNAFFSMIYTTIDTSLTIKMDSLIMSTIGNFMGATLYDAYKGAGYNGAGNARAVNLLAIYNTKFGKTLSAATAIFDLDFLKFACYMLRLKSNQLTNASVAFNMEGRVRHTPKDRQHIIMLDAFADAADIYLQSDTFHNELTKLPMAETVSYWQGTGTAYDFNDISEIDYMVKMNDGNHDVNVGGIIACIFDREALGVANQNRRVLTHYNKRAEFTNNWWKVDAMFFNDFRENFIIFFIADTANGVPAAIKANSQVEVKK